MKRLKKLLPPNPWTVALLSFMFPLSLFLFLTFSPPENQDQVLTEQVLTEPDPCWFLTARIQEILLGDLGEHIMHQEDNPGFKLKDWLDLRSSELVEMGIVLDLTKQEAIDCLEYMAEKLREVVVELHNEMDTTKGRE